LLALVVVVVAFWVLCYVMLSISKAFASVSK
jgi:hypothetical protein